jgi:hypothetical protein
VNGSLRGFVGLSLALHAGAVVVAALTPAEERAIPLVPDRFEGLGVEVDAVTLTAPGSAPPARETPRAAAVTNEAEQREAAPPATPRPERHAASPLTAPNTTASPMAAPRATSTPRPRTPARRDAAPQSPSASGAVGVSGSSTPPGEPSAAAEPRRTEGGSFGTAGLPAGVRHLPNAFTRALAIANRGDKRWRDLPLGEAGEARLRLTVNEDGTLGELEFSDESARDTLAPVVRQLLDNTLLLLKSGRFSLDPRRERPGTARLRVRVELTERSDANPEGDPGELFGVAWEAPSGKRPGKSGFVLNSGRQVTAWVWVE